MTQLAAAPHACEVREITGGVDTHNDTHTAAALDSAGRLLGYRQFPPPPPATPRCWRGCARSARWCRSGSRKPAELGDRDLIAHCATRRPDRGAADPAPALVIALRALARRHQQLTTEIDDLDTLIGPLVEQINPVLCALPGDVEAGVTGQLLVTAGQNPQRLRSEAAFAMLCGVAPLPASSGRTLRHRLNRGGDRQANAAIHRIVLCRLRWGPAPGPTRRSAPRRA